MAEANDSHVKNLIRAPPQDKRLSLDWLATCFGADPGLDLVGCLCFQACMLGFLL